MSLSLMIFVAVVALSFTAKALKAAGANRIFLYVTHAEDYG